MLKKICLHFFSQNKKLLFDTNRENISLLTGESGFYTVKITPISSKQLEERYFVMKFLMRNGLAEANEYDRKVFRIYQSFSFVFDIPCDRFEELKAKAEDSEMSMEFIKELPIIFHHQYSDMLKNNKNKF
jgi:hypothetical protein